MTVIINGGLEFDALINGSQFQAQINAMEQQLRRLTETANKESNAIERVAQKAAAAIGAYLSLSAATNFINKMIQVRGEFQQLEVAFSTMLQSKEKADQLLADVADLAAKTPFGLTDAAQGTKQLLAYGFAADEIVGTLTTLGNIASGVSAPLNDIVYLYGTLRTQGRAYTQDIKQFTGRGIPIIAELAKQFNVSATEVNDLVSAGKVGFPEIEKAFKSMSGEGGMFFNLMQEQSKTLVGQISNLSDAFDMMLNNLGKESQGIASTAIGALTTLVENYQTVLNILEVLIITYGTYKAAVIAVTAVERVRTVLMGVNAAGLGAMTLAEYLHLQALTLCEKAQKLLNATMLANPYVAVATVLAALTTALLIYGKAGEEVKTKEELLAEATKNLGAAIEEQGSKITAYVAILQNANSTEQERLLAMKELAKIDKVLIEGLNAKSISQEKLTENVNNYLEALREQKKLEANQTAINESLKKEAEIQEKIAYQEKLRDEERTTVGKKAIQGVIDGNISKLKAQREATTALRMSQVKQEAAATQGAKLTNAQLIAQAQSLEDIKAVKDKIEKQYQTSKGEKERLQFTNDLEAADKRIKELDPYSNHKKSAKEAVAEGNKFKTLLDQINDLESRATSVNEGKEDGTVAKIKNEVNKLLEKAKALNAGEGVVLRIKKAGQIIIDDAAAKAAARDLQNKINSELSNVNASISDSAPGSAEELALRKQAIAKRVELDISAAKQQYATDVESQKALQAKILEIKAAARRETLDLDRDAAKKTLEEQLALIKNQADLKNIQDQRIVDDPTSTQNQKYQAQERILLRNKKALQDMLSLLEKFALTGLGDSKDLTKQMGELEQEIAGVNTQLQNTTKQHLIDVFEQLTKTLGSSSGALRSFASDLAGINDGLSDTLNTMADLIDNVQQVAGVASVVGSIKAGKVSDQGKSALGTIGGLAGTGAAIGSIIPGLGTVVGAVVGAVAGVVVSVLKGGKKVRESLQKTYEAIATYQLNAELGEYRINALIRQRNLLKAQEVELTLKGIKAQQQALTLNQQQNKAEQDRILAQLQQESFISGVDSKKYGGFLGLWRKKMPVNQYQSLLGMTIDQIEALYQSGKLDGEAKALFEQLQALQQEGKDIAQTLQDLQDQADQIFTGTTADSITDSIVDGFKNGQFAAEDFAGNFEDLMRGAALNALKFQYLEEPLKAFYDQFAAASESDNKLTAKEIQELQDKYNQIIKNAGDQFNQLQDITGLNLATNGSSQNSLLGGIQGMSQQTAEVIAGQFGGLRLDMRAQVQICTQQLAVMNRIEVNTAWLSDIRTDIRFLKTQGIKIVK